MLIIQRILLLFVVMLAVTACISHEKYMQQWADRKARLQAAYPAGMERAEVHAKLRADTNGIDPARRDS